MSVALDVSLPSFCTHSCSPVLIFSRDTMQVYLKDMLAALLEVASADKAKQSSVTKATRGKKGKAKAKQQAESTPSTVTRDHILSLFELSPFRLRSSHVASVEKFIAHQHLYDLPPREERVHMLEERLEQQSKILTTASSSKTPATATAPTFSAAFTAPASPNKEAPESSNKAGVSPTRDNGIDAGNVDAQGTPVGKAKDLAFELFPESPAQAKANATGNAGFASPVKKQKKGKHGEESGSSGDEHEIPLAATASSAAALALTRPVDSSGPAVKDASGKEKNTSEKAKKELQRGRFGIWKLLTGILEGSTTGNQGVQSNHRFQHQSVM